MIDNSMDEYEGLKFCPLQAWDQLFPMFLTEGAVLDQGWFQSKTSTAWQSCAMEKNKPGYNPAVTQCHSGLVSD